MHLFRTTGAGARYGLDVDAFLADVTPAQFNEWLALYSLDPWGDDWVQTARLEAAIKNHSASPPETAASPADLVPTRENNAKGRLGEVPDEQLGATWRARLGGG